MGRWFVAADTHGLRFMDKVKKGLGSLRVPACASDILFLAGDSEVLNAKWGNRVIEALASLPCTVALVEGNHDSYEALMQCPSEAWYDGTVGRISDTVVHLRRGEVYTIGGIRLLTMGGAMMEDFSPDPAIALDRQWPAEIPTPADYRHALSCLGRHEFAVDFVLTHDGPESVASYRPVDPVRPMLEAIRQRIRFRKWYYGHHHRDRTLPEFECVFERVVEVTF